MIRVTRLRIKNFRQFRDFDLDLTDPNTGEPLEKICLIGPNGTGKSTLLSFLAGYMQSSVPQPVNHYQGKHELALLELHIKVDAGEFCVLTAFDEAYTCRVAFVEKQVAGSDEWGDIWQSKNPADLDQIVDFYSRHQTRSLNELIHLRDIEHSIGIYVAPDTVNLVESANSSSEINGLPKTTLGSSLTRQHQHYYHLDNHTVHSFWSFLIFLIHIREEEKDKFFNAEETLNLLVGEAHSKFREQHPDILEALAEQWNFVLQPAGLKFDIDNAVIPKFPDDNLEAYITLLDSGDKVPYNVLSTGLRNFIFRFGYVFSLYFSRKVNNGLLLIDEPEASLFPDLLYDIIDRYLGVIENTQLFVATHSSIIAAQFRPEERILLSFDEPGQVTWRRGVAPEGDDPNDLLRRDFKVRNLYSRKGIEQWERFLDLRRQIRVTEDNNHKLELLAEYSKIGQDYNFDPHEILKKAS